MKIVYLTRNHNLQAVLTLKALQAKNIDVDAIIFEPKNAKGKVQNIKRYLKKNGWFGLFWKTMFVLSDKFEPQNGNHHSNGSANDGMDRDVCALAGRLDIAAHEVDNHNGEQCAALLARIKPDLMLISGARILKEHIIDVPAIGCLNAHPGWLPSFRGMNANGWAFIERGKLGASVHFVDSKIDTGDILLRKEFSLIPGDTMEDMEFKGLSLCAALMADAVEKIIDGGYERQKQAASDGKQYYTMTYREERLLRRRLREFARQDERVL